MGLKNNKNLGQEDVALGDQERSEFIFESATDTWRSALTVPAGLLGDQAASASLALGAVAPTTPAAPSLNPSLNGLGTVGAGTGLLGTLFDASPGTPALAGASPAATQPVTTDQAPSIAIHGFRCGCAACTGGEPLIAAGEPVGATAPNGKPILTLGEVQTQLRTQWGGSQEGRTWTWLGTSTVTYSMPDNGPTTAAEWAGFVPMTGLMKDRARLAFELWDDVIAIELAESVQNPDANITFNYSSQTDGGGTYAYWNGYTSGSNFGISRAYIWLNSGWSTHNQDGDMFFGGYGFITYLHEIGHTLGLSHPGTYNAGGNQTITYANSAEYFQDTRKYTVMSYFDANEAEPVDHFGSTGAWRYGASPLLHDIAALQAAYGADTTTRTWDTTYGFGANAGRDVFDFSLNSNPIIAIWDAAGIDTLNGSGYSTNQFIDLTAGSYSSMGFMTDNVAIAFGCTIENAVGGSGSDTIKGNSANNALTGGLGLDTYGLSVAGWGSDRIVDANATGRVIFTGVSDTSSIVGRFRAFQSGSDYYLAHIPTGADITLVSSGSGWDFGYCAPDLTPSTSWNSISLASLIRPTNVLSVVNVSGSASVRPMGATGLASWKRGDALPVTTSDADGDPTYRYRFTDLGMGGTSAVLWYGGLLAQGASVELAASQLTSFWIGGGTTPGTDTVRIEVFDGFGWSAAQNLSVVTYNTAPTVAVASPANVKPMGIDGLADWIRGDALPFTASDADSDPVARYRFTDIGVGATSAVLWYGGQLAQGAVVEVPGGDLAKFWVGGGTVNGTDTLQVEVFDGFAWSTAQNISVVTQNTAPALTVTGSASVRPMGLGSTSWKRGDALPFTVSDADGDAPARYRFTDVGNDATSAVLWFGGQLAQGAAVEVAASDLTKFWIGGGTVSGTDTLKVEVFDGLAWSAAQNISVVTGNNSPATTVSGPVSVKPAGATGLLSWVQGTALPFTVSDAEGDAPARYRFTDVGSVSTTAQMWFAGSYLAQGGSVELAAGDLMRFWVQGGSVNGTETVQVEVFDGLAWSAAQNLSVVTQNSAPAVTVSASVTVQRMGNGLNSWARGDVLPFSVSDADGDAPSRYRFTDVGTSGTSAVLWYGGQLAQGAEIEVAASDIAKFWIGGGSVNGTDTVKIEAFDGVVWSAGQNLSVTTNGGAGMTAGMGADKLISADNLVGQELNFAASSGLLAAPSSAIADNQNRRDSLFGVG